MTRILFTALAALAFAITPLRAEEVTTEHSMGKGFTLKAGDFDLNLGGRLQARYTYTDYDGDRDYDPLMAGVQDQPSTSNFSVERMRIWLKGKAFKDWKYEFQADFGKGGAKLKDGYLSWSRRRQFAATGGQFKVRFDRGEYVSSGRQMFVDRNIASSMFGTGRDIGIMASGDSENMKIQWNVGAYNGEGEGGANPNNGHLFVGRISLHPNGNFGYSEVDIKKTDTMLWFVDLAAAVHLDTWTDAIDGSGASVKDGKIQDAELSDVTRFLLGAGFQYQGIYATGEYFIRTADFDKAAAKADVDSDGWYAQFGYTFKPQVWSAGIRYASVDPNDDKSDDEKSELTLGVNRFFHDAGHAMKLTGDVSQLREETAAGSLKDLRFRLQWQIIF